MLFLFLPVGAAITPSIGQYLTDSFVGASYTVNLVQTWSGGGAGPLAHLWSLAEEEQFYLLWPPVLSLLLWRRVSRRNIAIGLIAASLAGFMLFVEGKGGAHIVGRNPLARSSGLALGATMAILVDCAILRTVRRSPLWLSVALVVDVILLGSIGALPRSLVVPLSTLAVLPIVAHLATVSDGDVLARLLSWRPLVSLGGVSYSLYLWHYPFFYLLFVRLHWSSNYVCLLGIPAAVVIATASRHWVELPMLRLRERVTRHDPPRSQLRSPPPPRLKSRS